jgi:hypothetical protein
MTDAPTGTKRLNFFKGFLITDKDWNDGERYHIDKRKLHVRLLHAAGVVPGYLGELKVVARARGDLAVEVLPGHAVDGAGNDLAVVEPTIRAIDLAELRLPQTVYVVLRYHEELTDFIAYKESVEYKGHRRVLETCRVEIAQTEPDLAREVELARIYLDKGVQRIRDARDPDDPKPNEIDLRYVPRAGTAGTTLPPGQRRSVEQLLAQVRRSGLGFVHRGVVAAHGVVAAATSAAMLASADHIGPRNAVTVLALIADAEVELVREVDAAHSALAQTKEFSDYRRQLDALHALFGERAPTAADAVAAVVAQYARCAESSAVALGGGRAVTTPPLPAAAPPRVVDVRDWDPIKVLPAPSKELDLGGVTWELVDEIDILDKASEDAHLFQIKESKDFYRSRPKLKYPDGTVVEDGGRAHVGGYAEFKLANLTAGRPLMLLRRMDFVYGDYELELTCNGRSAGMVSCRGTDRVYRWRNWPALIAAELVTDATAMIRQHAVTAGRDINMFHIWAYQPRG